MKSADFFKEKNEVPVQENRTVRRITTFGFLAEALQAFNVERGVVYTIKQLFQNPGRLAKGYLTDQRYKVIPPFRLLLVSTALVIILLPYSQTFIEFKENFHQQVNSEELEAQMTILIAQYGNIWLWLFIPIVAFFSWIINRKSGYNYAENLVLHTFLYGLINVLSLFILVDSFIPPTIMFGVITVVMLFYYSYAYKEFYETSWLRAISQNSLIYILSSVVYTVVVGMLLGYLSAFMADLS